jgi:hypothetical protein
MGVFVALPKINQHVFFGFFTYLSIFFLLCRDTITFSEVQNTGPGADMSKRVKWEKHLPEETLEKLVDTKSFINAEGWIENQPSYKAKPLQSPNFQFV